MELALVALAAAVVFIAMKLKGAFDAEKEAFEKAKRSVDGAHWLYDHWHGDTRFAVSPETKHIVLGAAKNAKAYCFADVREWQEQWTDVSRPSPLGGASVGSKNFRIRVSVKDIEHPSWRIDFNSRSEMEKYSEILRQTV